MRNFLCGFILGITLLGLSLTAQAQQDTLWSRLIDVGGTATINGALSVADGFVLAGTATITEGNSDLFVAKLNPSGLVTWTNIFGSTRDEEGWGIAALPTGGYIMAGFGRDASNRNVIWIIGLSATGDSLWSRSYNSAGQTKARDIVQLEDNTYAVTGYRLGTDGTHSDLWLLDCQANGDTIWSQSLGGDQTDVGWRLGAQPDGGIAISGTTASSGGGGDDAWLVVTDPQGQIITNQTFGGTGTESGNAVAINEIGEMFVGGRSSSSDLGALVAKCSAAGGVLWNRVYTQEPTAKVLGLLPRDAGGTLCVGTDAADNNHAWFMSVDAEGNREWSWILQEDSTELFGAIEASSGGGLAFGKSKEDAYVLRLGTPAGIGGTVHEISSGLPLAGVHVSTLGNGYATISDANGHFTLQRDPGIYTLYGFGPCVETDTFQTVEVFADSLIDVAFSIGVPHYVALQSSVNITAHNHEISSEPFLIENSGSGEMYFRFQVQSTIPPTPWLSVDPPTGTVPAGETITVQVVAAPDTTDEGVWDYYGYLRLSTNSCPDSVDVIPVITSVLDANESSSLPHEFALHAAYPNPFNPSTTLSFDLPRASDVRLAIYDVTGRLVRELSSGAYDAGTHRVTFDAASLSTGVYFARFDASGFSAVQKLLLMK